MDSVGGKKVYCHECKHFGVIGRCEKVIGIKDTPYCSENIYATPEKHNKFNSCKYYEEELIELGK